MLSLGLSGGPWAAAKVYSTNCAGTEVGKPLTYALITNGSQVALFEVQEGSAAPLIIPFTHPMMMTRYGCGAVRAQA